ncbi:DDE-type integrase/transposase/recombinase [Paraburkholderia sp. CNPSo 3157]|uniref:DDE-type integrase/transposase/recombinase n=1 Tax=Paraburkholderia franconis TaxID=2654983 RepID=A0A7X1NDV1_9BURK|nr:Mu transposase C-terminal domain-containing protein [Paraburkholderia franconis]MPW20152.1 DDE-type integrase/transposase/recombinase [Paraburkholderia franconis]
MSTFLKDQIVFRGDAKFRIIRSIEGTVQLENTATGEYVKSTSDELCEEYMRGYLRVGIGRTFRAPSIRASIDVSPDAACDPGKIDTRRRVEYLVRLERLKAFGANHKELRRLIQSVSIELNDPRPPHITTVYRWRRRYIIAQADIRSLIANVDRRGGRGKSRLLDTVEALIEEKIESVYLASKSCNAEDVYDAVFLVIQHANTTRVESEWLRVPSFRTIQRRISQISAYDRAVAKYGEREAQRRFADQKYARKVSRILELVEIDHTPIDCMVADENGVAIGRPIITVVLDRFSRCVLGFSLSLAGYGTHSVFEAVRHALMPKTYLSELFPDLHLSWDCYGWFERILADNGTEFHADAFRDAMISLGIVLEFAASRDPNDKPHVERFLKTLNYSLFHKLPGTTLAKIHQRVGFKAEEDACLTFGQVNEIIHIWITSYYHLRPHRGLNRRSPIQVWNESAQAFPPQLKLDADEVEVELGALAESALQHYGIDLNTFTYVSPELLGLRRLLPPKSRVTVKYPLHDAGHIHVWDPIANTYIRADNKEDDYVGLTVEQAKLAKKAIEDEYRRTRANAKEVIRQKAKEAMASKELKKRKRGARTADTASRNINKPMKQRDVSVPRSVVVGNENDDVQDFNIDVL